LIRDQLWHTTEDPQSMVPLAILLVNLLTSAFCLASSPEHICKDVDKMLLIPGESSKNSVASKVGFA